MTRALTILCALLSVVLIVALYALAHADDHQMVNSMYLRPLLTLNTQSWLGIIFLVLPLLALFLWAFWRIRNKYPPRGYDDDE